MRFYVPPDSIAPARNIAEIKDRAEVHHIRDVMRLKKGDDVDIFDGKGREFSCSIEEVNRTGVIIKIKEAKSSVGESLKPSPAITLYQAIPKKNKMDFIIEKAVELGVENITPIITERTVPDIKDKASKKVERWYKIAMASSKQCGRVKLPQVSNIISFDRAILEAKKKDLVIFASLDKEAKPLKKILIGPNADTLNILSLRGAEGDEAISKKGLLRFARNDNSYVRINPKSIAVFVGPEGDFSPQEVSLAKGNGYNMCSLGNLVLKSETAAIYILSCLLYELQ